MPFHVAVFILITCCLATIHALLPEGSIINLAEYPEWKDAARFLSPENILSLDHHQDRSLECNLQLAEYVKGVVTFKLWALQMLDSSAKIPEGLLYANHEFLGQYDECLSAKNLNGTVHGKHCALKGLLNVPSFPGIPEGQEAIFWYGLCIPNLCKAADMNKVLELLGNVTKGLVTLTADDNLCSDKNELPVPEPGEWVVVGVLSLLGLLGTLSTAYDYLKQRSGVKGHPLLLSFSILKNGKGLFDLNAGGDQMLCVNGIKVLSMVWVVYFHVFNTMVAAPTVNIIEAFAARKEIFYAVLASAYLAVDTFLLVSGLLCANSFLRTMARVGTYDTPLSYIHRYFRLTPSYAIVLLFQVTLFRYIGDGPMWYFMQESQGSVCREYWWTGLLYIQNYVNPNQLCLAQTWYLSVDMQLFWLAPFVFYAMWKWKKFAPTFITFLILCFSFLPFALAYIYNLSPTALVDTTGDQNFLDQYPVWSRASPYLVGVALAYILIELKNRKIKMNDLLTPTWALLGWLAAALIGGSSLFGLMTFEENDYVPGETSLRAAFFLAFRRLGWAVFVAWLIFACVHGKGGPINVFLSWNVFQLLGKLTYGVYLVHISVLIYKLGIFRTNVYFNSAEVLFISLSVWLISYMISTLLYLFVEAPFFIIDRYLLRNAKILPLPKLKKVDANESTK